MTTLRIIFILIGLTIPCIGSSQNFKTEDLKVLVERTIKALQEKDTLAFIDLWAYNASNTQYGGLDNNISYEFSDENNIKNNFKAIQTNWASFLKEQITVVNIEHDKNIDNKESAKLFGHAYFVNLITSNNIKCSFGFTVRKKKGIVKYGQCELPVSACKEK